MEALKHSYKILSYNPETPLTNNIPPFNVYGIMNKLLREIPLVKAMVGKTTVDYDNYGSLKYIYNVKSKNYIPTVYEFIDVDSSEQKYAIENKVNFTITGAFQVEMDLLLHEFTRYLSTLYPNHKNFVTLYTDEEINDGFDETAHFLGYELNSAKHDILVQNIFGSTDEYEAFYKKYRNLLSVSLLQNSIGQTSSYRTAMAILGFDSQVYTAGRIRGNSNTSRVDTIELASLVPIEKYARDLQEEASEARSSNTSTTVEESSIAAMSEETTDTENSGNVKNYFVYNGTYSSSEPLFSNSLGSLTIDSAHDLVVTDIGAELTEIITNLKNSSKKTVANSYAFDALFSKSLSTDPTEDLSGISVYDNIYKSYIYKNYSSIVVDANTIINLTGKTNEDGTIGTYSDGDSLGGLMSILNTLYNNELNRISMESISTDLTGIKPSNIIAAKDTQLENGNTLPSQFAAYLSDENAESTVKELYNGILGVKDSSYTDEDKFVFVASPKDTNKYFVVNAADTSKEYEPEDGQLFLTRESFQKQISGDIYKDTTDKSPDFVEFVDKSPSEDFKSLALYCVKHFSISSIIAALSQSVNSISSSAISAAQAFKPSIFWKTFLSRDFTYSAKDETIEGNTSSFNDNKSNYIIAYRIKNKDDEVIFSGLSEYSQLKSLGTDFSVLDTSNIDNAFTKTSLGIFNSSSKALYSYGDKFSYDIEVVNIALLINALYYNAIKNNDQDTLELLVDSIGLLASLSRSSDTVTPLQVFESLVKVDSLDLFNTYDMLGYIDSLVAQLAEDIPTTATAYNKWIKSYSTNLETALPYIDMINVSNNKLGIDIIKSLYSSSIIVSSSSYSSNAHAIYDLSFVTHVNFVEYVYNIAFYNMTSYINKLLVAINSVFSQVNTNWQSKLLATKNIVTFSYDKVTGEKVATDSYNASFLDFFNNAEFTTTVIKSFVENNNNEEITKPQSTIVSSYSTLFDKVNIKDLITVLESQASTVSADFSTVSLRIEDGVLITDSAEDAAKFETGDLIYIVNNGETLAILKFDKLMKITSSDMSTHYEVHYQGEDSHYDNLSSISLLNLGKQAIYHQRSLQSNISYKNNQIKNNNSNLKQFDSNSDINSAQYVKRINDSYGNFLYVLSISGNMISKDHYQSEFSYPANITTINYQKYVDNSTDSKKVAYANKGFEPYSVSTDQAIISLNDSYNTLVIDPTMLIIDIALNKVLTCNSNKVLMCEDIATILDTDLSQINTIFSNANLAYGVSIMMPKSDLGNTLRYSVDTKSMSYISSITYSDSDSSSSSKSVTKTGFGPANLMPNTIYAFGGDSIEEALSNNSSLFSYIKNIIDEIESDAIDGDLVGLGFKINDVYNLSMMMWGDQIWDVNDTSATITSTGSAQSEDFRSFRAIWSSITVKLQLIADLNSIVTPDLVSNLLSNNYNLLSGTLTKYNYQNSDSNNKSPYYDINVTLGNKDYYEYSNNKKTAVTSYIASSKNNQIVLDHFGPNIFSNNASKVAVDVDNATKYATLERFFTMIKTSASNAVGTTNFDKALFANNQSIISSLISKIFKMLYNIQAKYNVASDTKLNLNMSLSAASQLELSSSDLSNYAAAFDEITGFYGIGLYTTSIINTHDTTLNSIQITGNYNSVSGTSADKAKVLNNVKNTITSKGAFIESLANNMFLNVLTNSILSIEQEKIYPLGGMALMKMDLSSIAAIEFTFAALLDLVFKAIYRASIESYNDAYGNNKVTISALPSTTSMLEVMLTNNSISSDYDYTVNINDILSSDKLEVYLKQESATQIPAVLIYSGICDKLVDGSIDLSLSDDMNNNTGTSDMPLYNLRKLVKEGHASRQLFIAIPTNCKLSDDIESGDTFFNHFINGENISWTILPYTGSLQYLSNVTDSLLYTSSLVNQARVKMFYDDNQSAKDAYYANFANFVDQYVLKASDIANVTQATVSYDAVLTDGVDTATNLVEGKLSQGNSESNYISKFSTVSNNITNSSLSYSSFDDELVSLSPSLKYKYFKMFDSQVLDLYVTYEKSSDGKSLVKYYNTKFSKAFSTDDKYAVIANMSKAVKRYPYSADNEMKIVSNQVSLGDLFPIAISKDNDYAGKGEHIRLLLSSNPFDLSSNMKFVETKISASDGNVFPAKYVSNFMSYDDSSVSFDGYHSFTVVSANAFKSAVEDDDYSTTSMFTTGMRFFKNYFIAAGDMTSDSKSIISLDLAFDEDEDIEDYITAGDKVYVAYVSEFAGDMSQVSLSTTSPIVQNILGDLDTVTSDYTVPENSTTLTDTNAENNPEYNKDYVIEAVSQDATDKLVSALSVPIQHGIGSLSIVSGYDGSSVAANDKLLISTIYLDDSNKATCSKVTVSSSEILNAFDITPKAYGFKIERPYQEENTTSSSAADQMKFRITANIADIVDTSSGSERHIYDNVPKFKEYLVTSKSTMPEFIEAVAALTTKDEVISFIKSNCTCEDVQYLTSYKLVESDSADDKDRYLEEDADNLNVYYDTKGIVHTSSLAYDEGYVSSYADQTFAPAQALLQYYNYIADNKYDADSAALKAREELIAQSGSTDEAFAQSHINDVMTRNGALRIVDGDVYLKTRLYEVGASVSESVLNALDSITDEQYDYIQSNLLTDYDALTEYLSNNSISIPSDIKDMSDFDTTTNGSHWTTAKYWKKLTDDESVVSTTFYENDDNDVDNLSADDMAILLSQDSYNLTSILASYKSVNIEDEYNLTYTQIKQGISAPIDTSSALASISEEAMFSTASFFYRTLKYFNETLLNSNGDKAFVTEDGELKAKSSDELAKLNFNFSVVNHSLPCYKAVDMEKAKEGVLKAKTIYRDIPVYEADTSDPYTTSSLVKEVVKPLSPFIEYIFGNDYYNITPLTYIDQSTSNNGNLSKTDLYALTEDKYIVNAKIDSRLAAISVDNNAITFSRFLPAFQFACSENGVNKKIAAEQRVYIKVPDTVLFGDSTPYDHSTDIYKIFAKMALEGNLDNFALRYRGVAKVVGYSVVLAKIANGLGIHFDEEDGYMDLVQKNADGTVVSKDSNGNTVPVALAEAIQSTIDSNVDSITSWTMPETSALMEIDKSHVASTDISTYGSKADYERVKALADYLSKVKTGERYKLYQYTTKYNDYSVIKKADGSTLESNSSITRSSLTTTTKDLTYDQKTALKTGVVDTTTNEHSQTTEAAANNFSLYILSDPTNNTLGVYSNKTKKATMAYSSSATTNNLGSTSGSNNSNLILYRVSKNNHTLEKINAYAVASTEKVYQNNTRYFGASASSNAAILEQNTTVGEEETELLIDALDSLSSDFVYVLASNGTVKISDDLADKLESVANVTIDTSATKNIIAMFEKNGTASTYGSTENYIQYVVHNGKSYYSKVDTFYTKRETYVDNPTVQGDNTTAQDQIDTIVEKLTTLYGYYKLYYDLHNDDGDLKKLLDEAKQIENGEIQYASTVEDLYQQLVTQIKAQQGIVSDKFGTVSGKLATAVSTVDSLILTKKIGELYITGDDAAALNDSDSTIVAITVPFVNGSRYMRSLIKDLKFKTYTSANGTVIFAYGYAEMPGWEEIPGETVMSKNQHAMAICKQAYELVKTASDCSNLQAALLSVVEAASNSDSAQVAYTQYAAYRRFGVIAYSTDYGASYNQMAVPSGMSGFGDAVLTCNVSDGTSGQVTLEGWLEQREWSDSSYATTVNKAKFTPYTITLTLGLDTTEGEANYAYISPVSTQTDDYYEGGFDCDYNATPEEILSSAASTSSSSVNGSSALDQGSMRGIANAIGLDKMFVNAYDPTAIGLNPTDTSTINISTNGQVTIDNDLTADETADNYANATIVSTNKSSSGRELTISSIDTATNKIVLDGEVDLDIDDTKTVVVSIYDNSKDTPDQSKFIDSDLVTYWLSTVSKAYENVSPIKFVEEVDSATSADRVIQAKYDLSGDVTTDNLSGIDGYPTVYEDASQLYYQYDAKGNPYPMYNSFGNTIKANNSSFEYIYTYKKSDGNLLVGTTGIVNTDELTTQDELDEIALGNDNTSTYTLTNENGEEVSETGAAYLGPNSIDDMEVIYQPATNITPESLSTIKIESTDANSLDSIFASSDMTGYYVENGLVALDIKGDAGILDILKYKPSAVPNYGLDYNLSYETDIGMAYKDTDDSSTPMFYSNGTIATATYNQSPYAPNGTVSYVSSVKTLLSRVAANNIVSVSSVKSIFSGDSETVTTSNGDKTAYPTIDTKSDNNIVIMLGSNPLSSVMTSNSDDGLYATISADDFNKLKDEEIGSVFVSAPGYGIALTVEANYKTSYLPVLQPVGSLIDVDTGIINTTSTRIVLPMQGYGFSQPAAGTSLDKYKDSNGYYVPYDASAMSNWTPYTAKVGVTDENGNTTYETRTCHYDAFDGKLFKSGKECLRNSNGDEVMIVSPYNVLGTPLARMPVPTYSSFKAFCIACGSKVYLPAGSIIDVNGDWTENSDDYSNIYKETSEFDNEIKYAYSIVSLSSSDTYTLNHIKSLKPLFGSEDNKTISALYENGMSVVCDVASSSSVDDLKNSTINESHYPIEVNSHIRGLVGAQRKSMYIKSISGKYINAIFPNTKSINKDGKIASVPATWSQFIVDKIETDAYNNKIYLADTDGNLIKLKQSNDGSTWNYAVYNDAIDSSKLLQVSKKLLYNSIIGYYKVAMKSFAPDSLMFNSIISKEGIKVYIGGSFITDSGSDITSSMSLNEGSRNPVTNVKTMSVLTVTSASSLVFESSSTTQTILSLSALSSKNSFSVKKITSYDSSSLGTKSVYEIDLDKNASDILGKTVSPYFMYDNDISDSSAAEYDIRSLNVLFETYSKNSIKNSIFKKDPAYSNCKGDDIKLIVLTDINDNICGWTYFTVPILIDIDKHMLSYKIHTM